MYLFSHREGQYILFRVMVLTCTLTEGVIPCSEMGTNCYILSILLMRNACNLTGGDGV